MLEKKGQNGMPCPRRRKTTSHGRQVKEGKTSEKGEEKREFSAKGLLSFSKI